MSNRAEKYRSGQTYALDFFIPFVLFFLIIFIRSPFLLLLLLFIGLFRTLFFGLPQRHARPFPLAR